MPCISESSMDSFDGSNGHREVKLDAAPKRDRRDPHVAGIVRPTSLSRPIRFDNEEEGLEEEPMPPPLIHEGTTLIPYNDETTDPSSKKTPRRPTRSRSSDRDNGRDDHHQRTIHDDPRGGAPWKERRRSESRADDKSNNDAGTDKCNSNSNSNGGCHRKSTANPRDAAGRRRGRHVVRMPYTDQFGDFGHYTGEVDGERRPNGRGKMKYENGIFFEGKWVNGRQDSMTSADRSKLLGGFTSWKGQMNRNASRRHVYGMEWIDVNGMSGTYTGTVDENSLPNGRGVMKYSMGLVAEGEWVRGILHGGDKRMAGIGAPLEPSEASSMIGRSIVGEMTYVSGLGMTSVCDPRARHQFD